MFSISEMKPNKQNNTYFPSCSSYLSSATAENNIFSSLNAFYLNSDVLPISTSNHIESPNTARYDAFNPCKATADSSPDSIFKHVTWYVNRVSDIQSIGSEKREDWVDCNGIPGSDLGTDKSCSISEISSNHKLNFFYVVVILALLFHVHDQNSEKERFKLAYLSLQSRQGMLQAGYAHEIRNLHSDLQAKFESKIHVLTRIHELELEK